MKRWIAVLLLAPSLAWANAAENAEFAAGRVLLEEEVLNAHYTSNSSGRVTVLFGRGVGTALIEAVVKRMRREPAIRGITYTQVDTDFCSGR